MEARSTLQGYLDRIAAAVSSVLGPSLCGLYLHGSAPTGNFSPGKSDVDLLAVVEDPPDRKAMERMGEALDPRAFPQPSPLDVHVVLSANVQALYPR